VFECSSAEVAAKVVELAPCLILPRKRLFSEEVVQSEHHAIYGSY